MYRKIYWLPLLGMFLFLPVLLLIEETFGVNGSGAALLFGLSFWGWVILGRWIARRLVPLFVTKVICPGCSEDIETVGVWNCACGFHDHRERHLLSGKCPKCGAFASHLDCPQCSATILLW
jgi:hypothetical protein